MPRSTQGQTGSARAVWPFTITEQVGPLDYGYGNLTTFTNRVHDCLRSPLERF